jgi:uncharacterized membrane protein (Fun14 family)
MAHSVLWESVQPILLQLGFGGLVGWSVGFLFKKTMKLMALLLALFFIGLQLLIYLGYLGPIDWIRIGSDVEQSLNPRLFDGMWRFLTHQFPYASGFALGFVLGLKMG